MIEIKRSPSRVVFLVFLYIILGILGLIFIVPVWHVVMASFSEARLLASNTGVVLLPLGTPTLGGYKIVLTAPGIISGYGNTAFYVIVGTVISMLLTIMGAYALSRKGFEYRNVFMLILSFTMLFNGGMIPTYMVVRNLGLYNSRWAVIIPSAISVFNLIILRTAFQEVPASLEESAKLDGANEFTIMFRIIVPLPAMIYLKDRDKFPLQLILRETLLVNDSSMIASSADAQNATNLDRKLVKYCTIVVGTLPIMCFYPFIQKYFTKGVMIGAVKG